jgi:lipopolysaccharide transport system ATP-binding protein
VALRDVIGERASGLFSKKEAASTQNSFWALRDISLDVNHGDRIGIVGRNGAGKSTLLKLLSRITAPTVGKIGIKGKVASLLEVGTGFHPELTGRENIFLNGAILGMHRHEIVKKFDEIVAFAEVEKFLDTPVKRYSSGMYVRLAFAVAAHMEPDVLLVDEVLAVGDAQFQKKCLGKMEDVSRQGRTVIFVSHNMGAVVELCRRGILLDHGAVQADSDMASVALAYSRQNAQGASVEVEDHGDRTCSITKLRLLRGDGTETSEFDLSDSVTLEITYRVSQPLNQLQITATLSRNGVDVVHSFDTDSASEIGSTLPGQYRATYSVPPMFLKAGSYNVRVTAGTPDQLIHDIQQALAFTVEEITVNTQMRGYKSSRPGFVISPGSWRTESVGRGR